MKNVNSLYIDFISGSTNIVVVTKDSNGEVISKESTQISTDVIEAIKALLQDQIEA